jgi:hypothetical protein
MMDDETRKIVLLLSFADELLTALLFLLAYIFDT